jgi:hypothetical protein
MSPGTEFMEKDDLLPEISVILNGMSGKVLETVVVEWEKPLQACLDVAGEYVE